MGALKTPIKFDHKGGSTMLNFRIVICLVTIFIGCPVFADDKAQNAEAAQSKAEILEQKAAADGSQASPSSSDLITKPEAKAVDPVGQEPVENAIICLARTIYWEAKGEGIAGMEAVANVVMNRLGHEGFPNTICGIVMQGQEQSKCQFSWWCDGRMDAAEEEKSYAIAIEIARKALNQQLTDRTNGALYFHHEKVAPSWSAEYTKTIKVGEHVFYKPPGEKAK
jgi:spore germination cell wall hydrolase CwlJ-like protein